MTTLSWHRCRRALISASWVILVLGGAVLITVLRVVVSGDGSLPTSFPWWLGAAVLVVLPLLCVQAYAEYLRRTYDPKLATEFDKTFHDPRMRKARVKAATVLRANRGNLRRSDLDELSDIEDVLDFLEDLGFYTFGDQITPEVAHHHFYHWVRGYYNAARDYIEWEQENEPAGWEYVKELAEVMYQVEVERSKGKAKKTLSEEDIMGFLNDEIALAERAG